MVYEEGIKEACGLFGIMGHTDAATLTVLGLFALQHRGEEAAGIASSNGHKIFIHTGLGHVNKNFDTNIIKKLEGRNAIGHTRYSVTGSPNVRNVQPILVEHTKGRIAVAHNGNITNSIELKRKLENKGAIFQTTMDSEIILHLIARSKHRDLKDAIIDSVKLLKGAFSLLFLTQDKIYAVRDPYGFRPLCLGMLDDANIVSSETSALDLVNAKYMGQVNPGEIVTLDRSGISREKIFNPKKGASCIFELVYFSRPDSLIFGQSVYQFRKDLGKTLAREYPVDADLVIPVPDSGVYAALGYAEEARLPFEMAITRNHYVGRTFIQPDQKLREYFTRIKLNPIKNIIHKKRIIIVDDSIVRGTTTRERIKLLRGVGAKEVHMRISCPPIKHPCFYGIDFPDPKKLIANNMTLTEARKYLNLDSLHYISLEGMLEAAGTKNKFCNACFTGHYPTRINSHLHKEALEN